jgi:hypothetical protein
MNFKERKKQDKLSSPVLLKVPVTAEYRNNLPVEFNASSRCEKVSWLRRNMFRDGSYGTEFILSQNRFVFVPS